MYVWHNTCHASQTHSSHLEGRIRTLVLYFLNNNQAYYFSVCIIRCICRHQWNALNASK